MATWLLPGAAQAYAPMCDATGATVMVPGPVVPAPLVNGGEIRQGEPCPPPEFAPAVESGTTHDQRSDTTLLKAPPDAALCAQALVVPLLGSECKATTRSADLSPPKALSGRVYRPPR